MEKKVKEQILDVRETGRVNMFDLPAVQKAAFDMECYELVIYIEEHRREYTEFILNGKE